MDNQNNVTITGTLVEQASMSETLDAEPLANFQLLVLHDWRAPDGSQSTNQLHIPCFATGHAANSIHKYGRAGVRVTVTGRLDTWNVPQPHGGTQEALMVKAAAIGYVSPREVFEGARK
ncbi:MAG: single-stranded DNA-binding protein [Planctomycetes bacterium]|nr:single-stranded DNA-binding protein [Planctomycetota bacterium]